MEEIIVNEKNNKLIKMLAWILIVLSAILLIRSLFALFFYSYVLNQLITPDHPFHFTKPYYFVYIIEFVIEFIICAFILISSIFVLKLKNNWRKGLVNVLAVGLLYLIVYPIVNYYNHLTLQTLTNKLIEKNLNNGFNESYSIWYYVPTVLIAVLFIYVIKKLSEAEIKSIFVQSASPVKSMRSST
ncbi:MAG: hypothetical protein WCZ90_09110 [Melioribacteraceae bacterium]